MYCFLTSKSEMNKIIPNATDTITRARARDLTVLLPLRRFHSLLYASLKKNVLLHHLRQTKHNYNTKTIKMYNQFSKII